MAPRQFTPPPHRTPAALLLTALLLFVPSCSNNDNDSSDPPPTTLTPEAKVEEAYLAYWEMATRLLEAPDPTDPEIAMWATEKARSDLESGLESLRATNRRSDLGDRYEHTVLDVRLEGSDRAVVDDCAVDDSRLVDATTGETLEQSIVTELLRVSLVRRDDRWLVAQSSRLNAWEGAVPCQ